MLNVARKTLLNVLILERQRGMNERANYINISMFTIG
jgi:hypothetical protein